MKTHRSLVVACAALSAFLGVSALPAACLPGGAVTLYEFGKTPGARIEKTDIPVARGAGASGQSDYRLVVTGSWDVSECGTVELRFAERAPEKVGFTLTLENEVGELPPSRPRDSVGTFSAKVGLPAGSDETATVIPPAMPELQAAVSRLQAASRMHTMPASGIFWHAWPHPYWTFEAYCHGQSHYLWRWSLDPKKPVVRVTLSWRGKESAAPVGIVARGPRNEVKEWPPYAKLGEEGFFPCVDRYGQFRWLDWPGKIHGDGDFARRLADEDADLAAHPGPASFDKWGGWKDGPKQEATGSFYVKKINGFWWFVDPDGNLWWSCGPLRVSASTAMTFYKGREFCFEWLPPEKGDAFSPFYKTRDELMWPYWVKRGITNTFDFSSANLCRKYGDNWHGKWADRIHRRLRSWGANTIGNSSDRSVVEMSRTPYVERFEIKSLHLRGGDVNFGWWPLRDPYDASFAANVREQLRARRYQLDDPWCVGFFVDNELPWGFEGHVGRVVWDCPEEQPAKKAFRRWLAKRHGKAPAAPSDEDAKAFSRVFAEEYFRQIRLAFDECAPKKLYLGCRGMALEYISKAAEKYVDSLSQNWYGRDISDFFGADLNSCCGGMADVDRPIVIGEFHCGALDRGVLNATLVPCKDQKERAAVIKQYLVSAITHPRFIGAHWHHLSDEPTFGRFDGEAMQNGWTDVCDTPYPETVEAIRWVGDNMYRLRWEASLKGRAADSGPRTFRVRDFGARGDGVAKDTAAVQAAVDAASAAGGGTVELDAGTYLSGTIWLKDNVDFHLAAGAVLKGSPDAADYCPSNCVPQNWASGLMGDNHSGGHLVCCVGRRNVVLRGPGRIDGNAPAFLMMPDGTHPESKAKIPWRPGQMIWLCDSSDLRISDLDIFDSPYWSCFLLNCDRVQIRGCRVFTRRRPRHTYNGDGIDIDRCRDVTVSDCIINTSDDSITLRASCGRRLADPHDCCHVTIANCVLASECNAVRFGVGEGKVHHIALSNLTIRDTLNAFNFVGAYSRGNRGTDITDVRVSNVVVDAERFLYFQPRFATDVEFRDIVFSGVSGTVRKPSFVRGIPGRPTKGLVMRDFRLPRDFDVDDTEIAFE